MKTLTVETQLCISAQITGANYSNATWRLKMLNVAKQAIVPMDKSAKSQSAYSQVTQGSL